MTDAPAAPELEPAGPRRRPALSAVWLVPLVAVLIAGAIAWQSFRDQGVLISVTFPDASGVTIGETTLRFREVVVGVVEDVGFTSDLDSVNVYIRVNNEIAPYLDEDAAFWIVQPQVTTRGVEGLGTILSGTYVEGTWDSEAGEAQDAFLGAERAPIVPPGVEGTAIVLRSGDSARLGAGAPILYRGIQVGEVAAPRLSTDGTEVRLDAFVLAPYDRQLTTATRFWDASGVTVSLGGSGFEISVGSIAAILEGGINFDTLISGGEAIETGYVFDIFDDRGDALASTFEAPSARSVRFSALFPSAASGLTEGAAVRYQGVRVGLVTAITGFVRPDDPSGDVQLLAVMALQPPRMGLPDMESDLDGIDFVDRLVRSGLRAQLVSTSILGGDLAIDLVDAPPIDEVGLEIGVADNPLIPTIEGDTASITASAEGVLTRINDLPVEELLAAATDLLNNVNRIASDESTRAIPAATLAAIEGGEGLVRDARAIVASPQTAGVLGNVQAITADLRGVAARVAEREVVDAVADALLSAQGAIANIERGTADLDALARSALVVFDEAGRIVSSEDVQAIPALAREAIDGGRAVLTSPSIAAILDDTAGATADVRRLAARLSTDEVAGAVEAALGNVDRVARNVAEGTADLGALRASIDAAARGAETLLASEDAAALPALAREAVTGARDLLAAPELATILDDIAATTASARTLVGGLDAPVLAAQVEGILGNLDRTAAAVANGTADLASLRAQIDAAVSGAASLLASEDVARLPGLLGETAEAARDAVASPQVGAILDSLAAASADLRRLTAEVGSETNVARIDRLLASVDTAAGNVAAGTADLAALRTSLDAAVAGAETLLTSEATQALPGSAGAALDQAGGLAGDARALLASPEIQTLLADLPAITADIRSITQALAEDQAAAVLVSTLEAAERAAAAVADGTANLPELSASAERVLAEAETLAANLNALTTKANALELDALVDATTDLMRTADLFLSSDEAGDVPVVLSATLEEVRRTVETIRTGGTLANLNATLVSASGAADSIQTSATSLPALVGRLQSLTEAATAVLATYDGESRVATELFAALRAATRAAEDVSSLSRTIERNPNSLLLGR